MSRGDPLALCDLPSLSEPQQKKPFRWSGDPENPCLSALIPKLLLPVLPICPAKPGYTNARFSWIEVLPGTEEEIVTEPSVSQYVLEAGTKCPPHGLSKFLYSFY